MVRVLTCPVAIEFLFEHRGRQMWLSVLLSLAVEGPAPTQVAGVRSWSSERAPSQHLRWGNGAWHGWAGSWRLIEGVCMGLETLPGTFAARVQTEMGVFFCYWPRPSIGWSSCWVVADGEVLRGRARMRAVRLHQRQLADWLGAWFTVSP